MNNNQNEEFNQQYKGAEQGPSNSIQNSRKFLSEDYIKFKKLLEFFIHILRANNKSNPEKFKAGEPKAGQGYKKNSKIRTAYKDFRDFSNGKTMDVNITSGFQLFSKTSYINWSGTGYNVRAVWNDEKDDIVGVQLFDNYTNSFVGEEYSLLDLGINDNKEPNTALKELFSNYEMLVRKADGNMRAKELASKLEQSYNIILRGAPGTGKTYLAKEIASELIGVPNEELADSDQFEFVQFHPSYDYTDFVEGLRPVQINGQVGFEPKDGIFKEFCSKARLKQDDQFEVFDNIWENFIDNLDEVGTVTISRIHGGEDLTFSVNSNRNLKEETESSRSHSITKENIFRVWQGEKGRKSGGHQARMKAVLQRIKDDYNLPDYHETVETNSRFNNKKHVFVIDEINRGEISKIFGELFFSIDPEYRGKKGAVSTQYSNLFEENEKFYIPENVYIIGTMNDIDRSVDTFDFAMRRRFTFEEVTAKDSQIMLQDKETKLRMDVLNNALVSAEIGLSKDYQIGASYFKVLEDSEKNVSISELWNNKLMPLLKDYFRGERNAEQKLLKLETVFFEGDTIDDSSEG